MPTEAEIKAILDKNCLCLIREAKITCTECKYNVQAAHEIWLKCQTVSGECPKGE